MHLKNEIGSGWHWLTQKTAGAEQGMLFSSFRVEHEQANRLQAMRFNVFVDDDRRDSFAVTMAVSDTALARTGQGFRTDKIKFAWLVPKGLVVRHHIRQGIQ